MIFLIGLSDFEEFKFIEFFWENIVILDFGKFNIFLFVLELYILFIMVIILSKYFDVFDDSVGKLEGELYFYMK